MGHIQKRYIYAGFLSGLFFIIIYGILDFNILISIPLTLVAYIGSSLLFKTKDIRELDSKNINNYYFWASKCANRASLTKDEAIIATVNSIAEKTDEIIVSLSQRPKKVEQVFSFFDYYLNITYKILYKYNYLKNNPKKTNDQEFLANTKEYLNKIDEMFTKQLANMQEAKMLDIESEIKIFEENAGLNKQDIEVGEQNEQ